ncbi:hypothetical protein JRO89_XS09G0178100 [Xanthoceras sorbifolium]|uniref:2Fe-2S ferredoxin-type domain-containing protein n=1 Tax=Xanthoceras sorbifolium TaxID=99658 RepID=A0ABQ8HLS3_9ROSI|nr:hypothetical protein JRO89_XS09G0178100 [Xanthoceras sorbifolium]
MGTLQLMNSYRLVASSYFNYNANNIHKPPFKSSSTHLISFSSRPKIRASATIPDSSSNQSQSQANTAPEPAQVNFAFVHSRPLLNCAGGGTCATCMVEVIEGKELLNPRTDKEKEKLRRKPKNWRLACQTTVGDPDSTGMVVIQQLPEWKAHEWTYKKVPTSELSQ